QSPSSTGESRSMMRWAPCTTCSSGLASKSTSSRSSLPTRGRCLTASTLVPFSPTPRRLELGREPRRPHSRPPTPQQLQRRMPQRTRVSKTRTSKNADPAQRPECTLRCALRYLLLIVLALVVTTLASQILAVAFGDTLEATALAQTQPSAAEPT